MPMPPNSRLAYVHGEQVRTAPGDDGISYVAVLKDVSPEGNGQTYLKIIDNPEQAVYVTKPQFRVNTCKKELEDKSRLDMYRTRVSQISATLWNAINNPGRWRTTPFLQPKKLLSNPYVYGADIDYGVILKAAYNRANGGKTPMDYNVGLLDIETDVNGTEQIILITFMNGDGRTFVGVLREFFLDHTEQEVYEMWNKRVEPEFRKKLSKKGLEAYTGAPPIKLEVKVLPDEATLLRWTFQNIHNCRPDFIGIWNIDYDVPYILNRCEFRGIDPKNLFCSPEVPYKYRVCRYKPDPGKKDGHLVDRWPWLHLTAFERWIDMMMLYGRLRKAKPREPSYKLDAIGGKEIGAGKLEFGAGESHSTMQRFHQVEYAVYNIVDVLIMYVMEYKNHDVRNMMMLIGCSTLDCFAHQSIQLKNYFYNYLDAFGCVPASIGDRIDDPWDYLIQNKGGAVLSPDNADIAVPVLIEDKVAIRASRNVCDIDVSSMYPSLLAMLNCAKETKVYTVLHIDNTKRRGVVQLKNPAAGDEDDPIVLDKKRCPGIKNFDVCEFFNDAIYTEANAMAVAKRFNLPGFAEIDAYMTRNYPSITGAANGQPMETTHGIDTTKDVMGNVFINARS